MNLLRLYLNLKRSLYEKAYAFSPPGRRESVLLRLVHSRSKKGWRTAHPLRLLSFYDKRMPFWDERRHDLSSNQDLTGLTGAEVRQGLMEIRKRFGGISERASTAKGKLKLGVQPLTQAAIKCWPLEKFQAVLKILKQRFDLECFFFGAGSEEALLREWAASLPHSHVEAGQSWEQVLKRMQELDFFLGLDSSVAHLAALCGVPACILYGMTFPARTAALGDKVLILQKENTDAGTYRFSQGYRKGGGLEFEEHEIVELMTLLLKRGITDFEKEIPQLSFPCIFKKLPWGSALLTFRNEKKAMAKGGIF